MGKELQTSLSSIFVWKQRYLCQWNVVNMAWFMRTAGGEGYVMLWQRSVGILWGMGAILW